MQRRRGCLHSRLTLTCHITFLSGSNVLMESATGYTWIHGDKVLTFIVIIVIIIFVNVCNITPKK